MREQKKREKADTNSDAIPVEGSADARAPDEIISDSEGEGEMQQGDEDHAAVGAADVDLAAVGHGEAAGGLLHGAEEVPAAVLAR